MKSKKNKLEWVQKSHLKLSQNHSLKAHNFSFYSVLLIMVNNLYILAETNSHYA